MLSIGIPTYNYNVDELVLELYHQCESEKVNYEILVLNDGSTIAAKEILSLEIINKASVSFENQKENKGRTKSRNKLASKAKYDWMLFLDADVALSNSDFIKMYLQAISAEEQIIFGGVSYAPEKPRNDRLLRWKYGQVRETKNPNARSKNPHFIISQNLLIRKSTFVILNNLDENRYGLDNYFSSQIRRKRIVVKHIDNPVVHLGLETSTHFLNKGVKAAETLAYLDNKNLIDNDLTPLQRAYLKLVSYKSIGVFNLVIESNLNTIEKNLTGKKPSLKLYDSFRLYHYIKAKQRDASA